MKFYSVLLLVLCLLAVPVSFVKSQSITLSKEFKLSSPFSEPDGRSDVVKISPTDFIALAKVKGSQSGKSDFIMERYDVGLNSLWQIPLSVETSEDYKDLFYNGKEVILLSVIHMESEKQTKLTASGFDVKDGKKLWQKELESYTVGDWQSNPQKGKVKESFIDLVCEHTNQDFVTPFEYKHNINFSPDQSKFISYVYNYGEGSLTASVCIYDNSCNLLKKGKVGIDNNFMNHGIYINNSGNVFILNVNKGGKINFIKYDLDTKDYNIVELPGSSYQKDDFHVQFINDDIIYVANSEVGDGKLYGVMYSKFNFNSNTVDLNIVEELGSEFKGSISNARKNNKQMKGEEDWLDYDITHFIVSPEEEVLMILEKRALHADGYPHIGRDAFDKSHKVEFTGHVQAETIILLSFDKNADLKWKSFILKNQVYPVTDGLNSISFVMDNSSVEEIRILYAGSANMDANLQMLTLASVNKATGTVATKFLPNDNKLTLVRDYTLFNPDNSIIIVGKKGLLGKASMIVKYKL